MGYDLMKIVRLSTSHFTILWQTDIRTSDVQKGW